MVKFAPSMLSADFKFLKEQLDAVSDADYLHVDIMDGRFVPNISMGPFIVNHVNNCTQLPLDVHLMIEDPSRYLKDFVDAGADIITVHWESDRHIHRLIQQIKTFDCKAGIAFNPATPLHGLEYIIDMVDLVLIMSVNPGFGGQSFIPQVLDKIKKVKEMASDRDKDILIEVDGGINPQLAPEVVAAGANLLVAGSSVFKHPEGPKKGLEALKNCIKNVNFE